MIFNKEINTTAASAQCLGFGSPEIWNHWPKSAQQEGGPMPLGAMCPLQVSCSPSFPATTLPLSGFPAARWQLLHLCISRTDSSRTGVILSVSLRAALQNEHWIFTPSIAELISQDTGDNGRDGERATPELCGLAVSHCHSAKLLYSSQPATEYWFLAFSFSQERPLLFCFPVFFGPKNTSERFRMEDVLTVDPSSRCTLRLLLSCNKLFATRNIYLFLFFFSLS